MRKEKKIEEDVSERIKSKIDKGDYPDIIKKFLWEVIMLEFNYIYESRPRGVQDEYMKLVEKYAKEWEV
ncbi:MAG: hypothetical protein H5T45_00800 [Thermoplasmatales archaeon]|nr:hypothetical protein [Thermoplasmatales archaeon]